MFGEIIEFVNKYFEKNGRSPSTREIEGEIGLSHVTVQRYLQVLRERGEIDVKVQIAVPEIYCLLEPHLCHSFSQSPD